MAQAAPALNTVETPIQLAARVRQEGLAAEKAKVAAAGALTTNLKDAEAAGLAGLAAKTDSGDAEIRRKGAERLSATVGGSPQTGAGGRLAAARSLGQQGLQAEQQFGADQIGREAQLKAVAAKDIGAAEMQGAEAAQAAALFEKELATEVEDKTARTADAISAVNSKLKDFEGFFNDDEPGAAQMVRNESLRFKDTDPELYAKLQRLADNILSKKIDIGQGQLISEGHLV